MNNVDRTINEANKLNIGKKVLIVCVFDVIELDTQPRCESTLNNKSSDWEILIRSNKSARP